MLDVARARAQELGLQNIGFRALNAEWIDVDAATVDAALCRRVSRRAAAGSASSM